MPKPRYKTTNWRKYNNSLVNRASFTFWIDEEAITEWKQPKQDRRERPRLFSDLAITTALMVKRIFSLHLKTLEGFIDSVFRLANVPLVCPHYTCISRRAKDVEVCSKSFSLGAFWEKGHPRNLAVGYQKLYGSNKKWKKRYGYHKRSLSETAMYRVKQLLGASLTLRYYNAQVGKTYAMLKVLNKLTGIGMPKTQYIV
ncbi:IS5/IS1182 family transposase [Vibrio anguillarum]|uniref:IS5/IS1182 family transposase n=1 Tax=Vibrio TaxID=662 RepID=UPI0006463FE9|nr:MULTISPECIES: IS5/IS1182 family transposase [Vibrio]MCC4236693.1 IS5/IS1182 family transposase [Vibrio anguillarum]MDQ2164293.1 IS5/IS1182 family transposase [Vibrio anguillarum]MDT3847972.1 IS5/IS1182 family transposase [Vibrio anguillarum]NNN95697.1 IS5/IS1182 family transposase [Vibrio sp. B4-6]NOI04579.1 IS5/IS1182 family transposase [Vibrio anguillarum]